MSNSSNGILGKAVALSLIVIVTVTSCPMVTQVPSSNVTGTIRINDVPVVEHPEIEPVPAFFYLTEDYKPTMRDEANRTGFRVLYSEAAENLVVMSEDRGGYPIVYFFGIEGVTRVEVHFAREGAVFPSEFVIHQADLPLISGGLSEYDEQAETFSLELRCESYSEKYDNLVLNKNLFAAYPVQGETT